MKINIIGFAINLLFRFLELAIIIDVILSWINQGRENQLSNFIHIFTEPFMRPARILQNKLAPGLMLDFSPIGAYFLLSILRQLIFSILGMIS